MLLPDSSIVPRFLRRKQPSDNSTLLLLQCTNRLKSSKDSVLSAPQLPQPPGLRLASRPNNVQMSRGIPSSWCSRRSIPVWSNICFICRHATCWTRSEGSTGEGWARTHSPATPGDSSKLWNYKTGLESLKRKELSIQKKHKHFPPKKLWNKIYFMIAIFVDSSRLEISSRQLTTNLEKYLNSLRS